MSAFNRRRTHTLKKEQEKRETRPAPFPLRLYSIFYVLYEGGPGRTQKLLCTGEEKKTHTHKHGSRKVTIHVYMRPKRRQPPTQPSRQPYFRKLNGHHRQLNENVRLLLRVWAARHQVIECAIHMSYSILYTYSHTVGDARVTCSTRSTRSFVGREHPL